MFVWKEENKRKRGREWPIFWKKYWVKDFFGGLRKVFVGSIKNSKNFVFSHLLLHLLLRRRRCRRRFHHTIYRRTVRTLQFKCPFEWNDVNCRTLWSEQDESERAATFDVGGASTGDAGNFVFVRRHYRGTSSPNGAQPLPVRGDSDIDVHQLLDNDHHLEDDGCYGQYFNYPLSALRIFCLLNCSIFVPSNAIHVIII